MQRINTTLADMESNLGLYGESLVTDFLIHSENIFKELVAVFTT
jgi:hypothetical protein